DPYGSVRTQRVGQRAARVPPARQSAALAAERAATARGPVRPGNLVAAVAAGGLVIVLGRALAVQRGAELLLHVVDIRRGLVGVLRLHRRLIDGLSRGVTCF